ncbi:NACHT, LRR and PYD domains-containing protein 12-like [Salminus brasiliensis]|uniref:NACHT, LRR and PYD domains-containing protein 12-like n=1 Tax=Salminus brasiliensis TaxID=930266 RepID=UPI003B839859
MEFVFELLAALLIVLSTWFLSMTFQTRLIAAQTPSIQSTIVAQTPSIQSTATDETPWVQSSTTAQTPSIQSTATAQTPSIQSTATAQTPSIQSTATAQTPSIQSTATAQTPSIQSSATAQTPSIQSSATAQTPSIQSTATAQTPSIQFTATAQAPSIQFTATAQAPSIQSSTIAQTPSIQSTATAQTPSIQSTATAQTPSIHSTATAQTPSIQSTATAQTPSIHSTATAQTPSIQSSATAQTPSIQSTATAQTPSIQFTATAQAPSIQSSIVAQTPSIQSTATDETPWIQSSTTAQTPSIQSTATAQTPSIQSTVTAQTPSIQSTATDETPWIQSSTTAQTPSIQSTITAQTGGSINAPALHHNVIHGPVSIEICSKHKDDFSDTADLRHICVKLKSSFIEKFGMIDSTAIEGKQTPLEDVYTELYITEGESDLVNNEHEIWQIERASRVQASHDASIACDDILTPSERSKKCRIVLTKGIAGIGKSVSVQRFVLNWAQCKAKKDVDLVLYMPFRELNLYKGQWSLQKLLWNFHPELEDVKASPNVIFSSRIVLILDGLDESRLPLAFESNQLLSDVTKQTSLDVLITNILKGNLLSSAQVWVTSRPEASLKISRYTDRVTEIRGFTDQQKLEYFRKQIKDETLANAIISHVKMSRSLHIMCHIPVFCLILVSVLQSVPAEDTEIPKTLTEMYIHFLIIQTRLDSSKHGENLLMNPVVILEFNKTLILKLAKLAFEELMKGNLIFSEKELRDFNSDLSKVLMSTGLCTAIFKRRRGIYREKFYSFIHMSFQEFLAALHVFLACVKKDRRTLEIFLGSGTERENMSLQDLLKKTVDKALLNAHGSLDLFLRFLLGISLEANQDLLQALLLHREDSAEVIESTCKYIKGIRRKDISPERCINLFLCLLEMNDNTLHLEIQEYLQSEKRSTRELSPAQCSALAYVLLMSEEVLDEFDLKKYITSVEGRRRLVPAVKCCRKALLADCELSEKSIDSVALALQLANSHLRELDMSYNDANASFSTENKRNVGVSLLSDGLKSPNCKLETLRLVRCNLNQESCKALTEALSLKWTCLRELDLSTNDLQDSGVEQLLKGLKSPHCKLEKLRLIGCHLTEVSGETLALALSSDSTLRELNLSDNDLQDSGVKLLSVGLGSPLCKLEILKLSGCMITEDGCCSLASALSSNQSQLKDLDLSYNHPGESGMKLLLSCKLKTLNTDHGGQGRIKPGLAKYACELTLDPNTTNTNLTLSEDNRRVIQQRQRTEYPKHRERFEFCKQVLCKEPLFGRHYWEAKWHKKMITGLTYKEISRKGQGDDCSLGFNDKSWSLEIDKLCQSVCHKSKSTVKGGSTSTRVGVYLDWPAGTLSFYSVSERRKLTHIHTFQSRFTAPLYAGFKLDVPQSSVSLCSVD